MKIISTNKEKREYREIENILYSKKEKLSHRFVKKKFNTIEVISDFDMLGEISFYQKVLLSLRGIDENFCISTILDYESIFLFNTRIDSSKEYLGVMNYPKLIGSLLFNDDVGLSQTHEIVLIYSVNQEMCIYANRYYDEIVMCHN